MNRILKILAMTFSLSVATTHVIAQNYNDAKYLQGAVPEDNGTVVFQKHCTCDGKSQGQIYEALETYVKSLLKSPVALQHCRITKASPEEGIVAASMEETLTFKSTNWTLDTTRFFYQIIFTARDGEFDAMLRRIHYIYDPMKVEGIDSSMTAEDWITDAKALNKKGQLTRVGGKKFRLRTIDRKDELFDGAYEAVMQ